jgi:hypothetical protein
MLMASSCVKPILGVAVVGITCGLLLCIGARAQAEYSGDSRQAAQPGGVTCMKSRQVQKPTETVWFAGR